MTTNWTLPRSVTQYAEEGGEDAHVTWADTNGFYSLKNLDGKFVSNWV
jgi:hypothetical protein